MISWPASPTSAQSFSMRSIRPGNMRSDSASARPQVGSAGQAMRSRVQHAGLIFRLHAVCGQQRVDAGLVRFGTLARMMFWFADRRNSSAGIFFRHLRARRFSRRGRRTSLTRPDSTNSAEKPASVHGLVPAEQVAGGGEPIGLRGRQREVRRVFRFRPGSKSTPRSATTYLNRACLRSVRSPKSRWIVSTAFATSTTLSGGKEPDDVRHARIGLLIAMTAAHAAANGRYCSRSACRFRRWR